MARTVIRLTGLEAVNALDGDIVAIPTRRLLERGGISVQRSARKLAPKDRGGLRRSITWEVDKAHMPRFVKIGTNSKYGKATEFGRPAGIMPPVAPLERWGRKKLSARGLGWRLAMSIKKKGIDEKPYLRPALDEFEPKIPRLLTVYAREIEQTAKMLGGG